MIKSISVYLKDWKQGWTDIFKPMFIATLFTIDKKG